MSASARVAESVTKVRHRTGTTALIPSRRGKRAIASLVPEGVGVVLKVVMERYGLDGHPPRSVDEVAWRLGIPRLSVRQVEGEVLRLARSVAHAGG